MNVVLYTSNYNIQKGFNGFFFYFGGDAGSRWFLSFYQVEADNPVLSGEGDKRLLRVLHWKPEPLSTLSGPQESSDVLLLFWLLICFVLFFLCILKTSILFTTHTPNMKVLRANSHNTEHLNAHSGFKCNKAAQQYGDDSDISRSRNNHALHSDWFFVCLLFSNKNVINSKHSRRRIE